MLYYHIKGFLGVTRNESWDHGSWMYYSNSFNTTHLTTLCLDFILICTVAYSNTASMLLCVCGAFPNIVQCRVFSYFRKQN